MRSKKGISDIIAWVLLIGFTIAMAAFVSTWVIEQTKKFNPEDVAGGAKVYCDEVVLSIENKLINSQNSMKSCADVVHNGEAFGGKIVLKNRGKFTIYNIKGLGPGMIANSIQNFPSDGLKPGESTSKGADGVDIYFTCSSPNQIELVPEIKIDGKEYYCSDSSVIISDASFD